MSCETWLPDTHPGKDYKPQGKQGKEHMDLGSFGEGRETDKSKHHYLLVQ